MAQILHMNGDPEHDAHHIAQAAAVIRAGGIVAIPTETVYGLAADALNPEAIAKIYEAKGRPATNPLIIHVTSIEHAQALAAFWPPIAQKLAEAFWPGPLTLVVQKNPEVPDIVTAGMENVAIRMPSHPVMRAVIEAAETPLAAPSANKSQAVSPTRAGHVLKSLGDRVDLILDAGTTEHGLESTVIDCTSLPPRMLRPGPITPGQIEAAIGMVVRTETMTVDDAIARASPGMSVRHYAPNASVRVVPSAALAATIADAPSPVAAFLLGGAVLNANATKVQMPGNPVAYGAALYNELHRMDDAGMKTIVVEEPPDEPGWEAVRDRLRRAGA